MKQHELVPNPPPHLEDNPLLRVTDAMSQVNERGRGRIRHIRVTYPRRLGTHCDILKNRWGNILPPGIYHMLFHGEY